MQPVWMLGNAFESEAMAHSKKVQKWHFSMSRQSGHRSELRGRMQVGIERASCPMSPLTLPEIGIKLQQFGMEHWPVTEKKPSKKTQKFFFQN